MRKRKGYFLELAEEVKDALPEGGTPQSAPAIVPAPVASAPGSEPKPAAETLVVAADVPASEVTPKRTKKFRGKAPEQSAVAPAPIVETVVPAPQPVKTPSAKPEVVTFATDYLMPTPGQTPRRRPGANMTAYLDMARQMKQ
ncbi:hypothetical protein BST81_12760 [Leptolyngbya sp. 'hensonii']|nr:hypothetical protein BST81_12760 [Leptolyngbya sp. 'hensonii']